jgi:hypothetical protein
MVLRGKLGFLDGEQAIMPRAENFRYLVERRALLSGSAERFPAKAIRTTSAHPLRISGFIFGIEKHGFRPARCG